MPFGYTSLHERACAFAYVWTHACVAVDERTEPSGGSGGQPAVGHVGLPHLLRHRLVDQLGHDSQGLHLPERDAWNGESLPGGRRTRRDGIS